MATIILEDHAEVPIPAIETLAEFRRWALSAAFPQHGRIDYVDGRIEVDMSPEDFFTHGTLKSEVAGEIKDRVQALDLGHTLIAETRISSGLGNFSAEPDVVVVTYDALDDGRVQLTPKSTREEGRFVEVEGAPDLIVEIVSDSSVTKDTQRLPVAYFAAGVAEFWLVDGRGAEMSFRVHQRGNEEFVPAAVDDDGYQRTQVLRGWCHLQRSRHQRGHWVYQLLLRE